MPGGIGLRTKLRIKDLRWESVRIVGYERQGRVTAGLQEAAIDGV